MPRLLLLLPVLAAVACNTTTSPPAARPDSQPDALPGARIAAPCSLGAFSISMAVKDLATSIAFYEQLGFRQHGEAPPQGYAILRNGDCLLGLFQGMFEGNMLTFNPGWTPDATAVDAFLDVRQLQQQLEAKGIVIDVRADAASSGPASIVLKDPDGNVILIDQHVAAPK